MKKVKKFFKKSGKDYNKKEWNTVLQEQEVKTLP